MNDRRHQILLIHIAASAISVLISTAPAKGDDRPPRFLRIPVLFITDRNLAPPKGHPDVVDFGPHRKYLDECKHDPLMGTA